MRLHNVSSLGRKQLSDFFITLHLLFVGYPRDCVCVTKKQNTSRLDPL